MLKFIYFHFVFAVLLLTTLIQMFWYISFINQFNAFEIESSNFNEPILFLFQFLIQTDFYLIRVVYQILLFRYTAVL